MFKEQIDFFQLIYGESDFPCDNCKHDIQGCCNYDDMDDYCVLGDKQVPIS